MSAGSGPVTEGGGNVPERLERLEEAVMFAEHDRESLAEHVALLEKRVSQLMERLTRLEAGITRMGEALRDNGDPDIAAPGDAS